MVKNTVMSSGSQDVNISEWASLDCPFCQALFKVNKNDLQSPDHHSFSCLSCQHIFWAGLNEQSEVDVWTFKPSSEKNVEKLVNEEKLCTHCFAMMKKGTSECLQCGKSFYDTEWMQASPHASFHLRKLFEELLCSYESSEKHGQFVASCVEEENIPFGLFCYGRILKKRKSDKQAFKMFQYLKSIVEPLPHLNNPLKTPRSGYLKGWFHAMMFCFIVILISLLIV